MSCDMFPDSKVYSTSRTGWITLTDHMRANEESENHLYYDISIDGTIIKSASRKWSSGDDLSWFDMVCKKYGDIAYNQFLTKVEGYGARCILPDITDVTVFSNKPFDSEHKAGQDLSDCFSIIYKSNFIIVESGYSQLEPITVEKPLSELSSSDLKMLCPLLSGSINGNNSSSLFKLNVAKMPSYDSLHNLTFVILDENDNNSIVTLEYDFRNSILASR